MPEYPEPVARLQEALLNLPGVIECFPTPHHLESVTPDVTCLPGEYADLPQVPIARTNGGLKNEMLLNVDFRLDRSEAAWLTVEFLAWWVRDQARSGEMVQMRPVALPPRGQTVQLGATLRFLIEHFHIDDDGSYSRSMEVAGDMADSINQNYTEYQDCFNHPASYDPEDIDEDEDEDDEEELTPEELRELSERGNADAQFELGQALLFGNGVEEDPAEAVTWFQKAADAGQPAAQFMLGRCYSKGTGVEQSYPKALEQYSASAESGVGIACASIGEMYADGLGVPQSHARAFEWYQRGYDLGEVVCLAELGDCYEHGNGVTRDLDRAMECYQQCLDGGFELVQEAIDRVQAQLG